MKFLSRDTYLHVLTVKKFLRQAPALRNTLKTIILPSVTNVRTSSGWSLLFYYFREMNISLLLIQLAGQRSFVLLHKKINGSVDEQSDKTGEHLFQMFLLFLGLTFKEKICINLSKQKLENLFHQPWKNLKKLLKEANKQTIGWNLEKKYFH